MILGKGVRSGFGIVGRPSAPPRDMLRGSGSEAAVSCRCVVDMRSLDRGSLAGIRSSH